MDEGYYKAYTNNYSFSMSVLLAGSTYTIWYGDVENREGPCVELTYDTEQKEVCKLQGVSYYSRCARNKSLVKSEGTIEMLQSVLKLMIEKFPDIKRVVFNDVSSIECSDGTSAIVSYTSLTQHGKTWYERYFGARMVHKHERNKLEAFKELLSRTPTQNVFSFYDNQDYETWYAFFVKMRETYGCEFFSKYQKELQKVAKIQLMYSEWYIRAPDIMKYQFGVRKMKAYKKLQIVGQLIVKKSLSLEDVM